MWPIGRLEEVKGGDTNCTERKKSLYKLWCMTCLQHTTGFHEKLTKFSKQNKTKMTPKHLYEVKK